jgi:hypothetical protein
MNQTEWAEILLTAGIAGLVGGGSVAGVLFRAMRETLRETFLSEKEARLVFVNRQEMERRCAPVEDVAALETRLTDQLNGMSERKRREIDRCNDRVSGVINLVSSIREATDGNRDKITHLEGEVLHQAREITLHVISPLREITLEVRAIRETQAAQSTALQLLAAQMEKQRG